MNTTLLHSLVVLCLVGLGHSWHDRIIAARKACEEALPGQSYVVLEKERGEGRCSDLCSDQGLTCQTIQGVGLGRAIAVYMEWEPHFYPSCNTLYSNACCCQASI